MTKSKSEPRRGNLGRPAYPLLDMYVRFEATRRLAGKSINAHAKAISLSLIGGHMPQESFSSVTGEALRRHIQLFRRSELAFMDAPMRQALERRITDEASILAQLQKQDG